MSNLNYEIYRCPDPRKTVVDQPWFRTQEVCPCNPADSNVTGRGYTPCNFGLQMDQNQINMAARRNTGSVPLKGALYQDKQFPAPQLDPRQLTRIGNQWRNPF